MSFGLSLEDLTKSLSGIGSESGSYVSLSVSEISKDSVPKINWADFSEHSVFGNAQRRFAAAMKRLQDEYPIGLSGTLFADVNSLSAENILQVDDYLKKSNGFDLWLLEQMGKSSTGRYAATKTITAEATNEKGEIVPLIHIHRDEYNNLTNSTQQSISAFIQEKADLYEEESISLVDSTPGTSYSYYVDLQGGIHNDNVTFDDLIEIPIARNPGLENLLPEVLFYGDEEGNLKKILDVLGEEFDILHTYINQIKYIKKPSYDNTNTTPDELLSVVAEEYGIELFDSAVDKSIEKWLVNSSSGDTAKEITFKIWKRILKSVVTLLKNKGTMKSLRGIVNLYGLSDKIVKPEEYSIFNKPVQTRQVDYVDIPVLYSDGTNYVQTVAGLDKSSRVFDFPSETDFTIEARISATAQQNHTIIKNPSFTLELTDTGRLSFIHQIDGSVNVTTPDSSISALVHKQDHFVNAAVKKDGDDLTVYLMSLSSSLTSSEEIVFTSSASINLAQISSLSFDTQGASQNPPGGITTFPTEFPANGLFNGYIQEVRVWSKALSDNDLREHTRNFESTSFQNSTNVDWDSLSAHWKLRENYILDAPYNFIQNSAKIKPTVVIDTNTYNDLTVDGANRIITSNGTDFETENLWQIGDVLKLSDATEPLNNGVEVTIENIVGSDITIKEYIESQGVLNSTLTFTRSVESTNDNKATPINFNSENKYRVFEDVKKINKWYPSGLFVDKDKVLQEAPTENEIDDSGVITFSLKPIDSLNADIQNAHSDIKIGELLGDPENLQKKYYDGAIKDAWSKISSRYNIPNTSVPTVDINAFIKAMSIFNDTLGGMFPFVEQFLPAKSNLNAKGVLIENPLLERNKIKRNIGNQEAGDREYEGAPSDSSTTIFKESSLGEGIRSNDFEGTDTNVMPSVISKKDKAFGIMNHYLPGALLVQDSSSANISELHPTACTTASFQGFKYTRDKSFLDRSLTTERSLVNVTKRSTVNGPRISEARVAKLLPVKRLPANPENTEIDITLNNLIINPILSSSAAGGFISGKVRLLSKGQSFNSESPTFRFEFPTSADGTNLFIAEMGDLDAGQGRIIEDIDNIFVTNVIKNDVQMKLTLANVVTSLSAVGPGVTVNEVTDSGSGSLGVVPIRITNLFNNNTQIVRVAINAIDADRDIILTQLSNQGGVKLSS